MAAVGVERAAPPAPSSPAGRVEEPGPVLMATALSHRQLALADGNEGIAHI
jgi:hypothetical protein